MSNLCVNPFKSFHESCFLCSRELPGGSWEEGSFEIMCKSSKLRILMYIFVHWLLQIAKTSYFPNGFWISGIGIEKTPHFIIYLRSLRFKSDDSCTLLYIRPSKMTTVAHFNLNLLFLHVFLNIWVDLGGSSFRKPSYFTSGIAILGARRRPDYNIRQVGDHKASDDDRLDMGVAPAGDGGGPGAPGPPGRRRAHAPAAGPARATARAHGASAVRSSALKTSRNLNSQAS